MEPLEICRKSLPIKRIRLVDACWAPDCKEEGKEHFLSQTDGWFAYRLVNVGDWIHLCPEHAHPLYIYRIYRDVSIVPEWMFNRPRRYESKIVNIDSVVRKVYEPIFREQDLQYRRSEDYRNESPTAD